MSWSVAKRRCVGLAVGVVAAWSLVIGGAAQAQQAGLAQAGLAQAGKAEPLVTAAGQPASTMDASRRIWELARQGEGQGLLTELGQFPDGQIGTPALKSNVESLKANIAKREEVRAKKLAEARSKFDEELAKNTTKGLSEAVRRMVEMYVLTPEGDRQAFKRTPEVAGLIEKTVAAAKDAESKHDWFTANELYFRLNALMEEEGTYREDQKRLSQRLTMIRMYQPERFWERANTERVESGKSPLPPFNDLGEKYEDKLKDISRVIVVKAIISAVRQHIDRETPPAEILVSGLESVKLLATTPDLDGVFPGLKNGAAREAMAAVIDHRIAKLRASKAAITGSDLTEMLDELDQTSKTTVNIPENALLHEFGNGVTAKLDEFSAIIWPDELTRFDRLTQGNFVGVGVQIQIDEETHMVKVVTPIEGTPAQRAGIRMGDLIKKINGKNAVGITVNQAVDNITGPKGTEVILTMERPGAGEEGRAKDIDFNLTRAVIPLHTVKGWRRTGLHETDWDWFIDHDNKIGYVRLSQFTDDPTGLTPSTTEGLRAAIASMVKSEGKLGGLILDLRFNPGGLLTEAVSVANTFIDKGEIVSTRGSAIPGESKSATPGESMLGGAPLIVLVNEGSASASEIVSGAIRHYADKGDIAALILGQRSFGKGSVQNVFPLTANAKMKLTTQYYYLPDGRLLHRKPGATVWGVDPHLKVEDLSENLSDAIKLRQDADVLPLNEKGEIVESKEPRPDPSRLLDDGLDLQLQHALAILQAASLGRADKNQAHLPMSEPATAVP